MIPGLGTFIGAGAGTGTGLPGGVSASSSASSDARSGAVTFGDFVFQPKGGNLPPVAWIALAVVGGLVAVYAIARKR